MGFTAGGCRDLRKYQDSEDVASIFGKLVSGKSGYKTIIEKSPNIVKCINCGYVLLNQEKFCPECGTKSEENKK